MNKGNDVYVSWGVIGSAKIKFNQSLKLKASVTVWGGGGGRYVHGLIWKKL